MCCYIVMKGAWLSLPGTLITSTHVTPFNNPQSQPFSPLLSKSEGQRDNIGVCVCVCVCMCGCVRVCVHSYPVVGLKEREEQRKFLKETEKSLRIPHHVKDR